MTFLKKAIAYTLKYCHFFKSDLLTFLIILFKKNNRNKRIFDADTGYVVYDFGVAPYALGDILTWSMRRCVQAISEGKTQIDLLVLSDPNTPGNRFQNYIINNNYQKYLLEMTPVFFFNPLLRNVHFFKNRSSLEMHMAALYMDDKVTHPKLHKYATQQLKRNGLESGHDTINSFYRKNGYLPRFVPPKGIHNTINTLFKSYNSGTFFVVVHLRQRQNETESLSGGAENRDADSNDWINFFNSTAKKHPEVRFLMVGRPIEWDRQIYNCSNVTLLKTIGFGLTEELACIIEADMFVGSNSGPAAMAVFGKKPYLIFQIEGNAPLSAKLWGVDVGSEKLPIAHPNQKIYWGNTNSKILISEFEKLYEKVKL